MPKRIGNLRIVFLVSLGPAFDMFTRRKCVALGKVAMIMRRNEIVSQIMRIAHPWNEMVHVHNAQSAPTVEAPILLQLLQERRGTRNIGARIAKQQRLKVCATAKDVIIPADSSDMLDPPAANQLTN